VHSGQARCVRVRCSTTSNVRYIGLCLHWHTCACLLQVVQLFTHSHLVTTLCAAAVQDWLLLLALLLWRCWQQCCSTLTLSMHPHPARHHTPAGPTRPALLLRWERCRIKCAASCRASARRAWRGVRSAAAPRAARPWWQLTNSRAGRWCWVLSRCGVDLECGCVLGQCLQTCICRTGTSVMWCTETLLNFDFSLKP
jgi:hypothetical protein